MKDRRDGPDVRQLASQGLPCAEFPAARSDFRVHFDAEVHARIVQHAGEDRSVEICGVLVGRWAQDADGPYVAVSESIRCDDATKKSGEVTFTHDSWTKINHEMDTRFVDLKIVGWYHSHPGFGIFLSERDTFIHEHFFSNPGQVAFVVDPRQRTEGLFVWSDGRPKPCEHYWIGGRIHAAAADKERPSGAPAEAAAAQAAPASNDQAEPFSMMSALRNVIPWVAVFLIGYLLAGMKTASEQRQIIEGTVAHFGLWKGLRPGLKESLATAADNLAVIRNAVGSLGSRHVKTAGEEAAAVRAAWDEVGDALRHMQEHLHRLEVVYGLDPAETAAMKSVFADKLAELGGISRDKGPSKSAEKNAEKKSDPPTSK